MTREWADEIPTQAGVYVFKENDKIVYVGETGNLRGRMKDLLDSRHHTIRRTIGVKLYASTNGFVKATSKNKFPSHIELLVNEHICNKLSSCLRRCSKPALVFAVGQETRQRQKYPLNYSYIAILITIMSKRVLGIVFIILAILLTLAIIGQLPLLLTVIIKFLAIFRGNLDSSQIGETVGQMIYWILHFSATIVLWKYGVRWSRKAVKK